MAYYRGKDIENQQKNTTQTNTVFAHLLRTDVI